MGRIKKVSPNYDFFIKANMSRYKGEWIAIAGNKVIAHGKDAQEVYQNARKKSRSKNISLAKTPDEQMLILTLSL